MNEERKPCVLASRPANLDRRHTHIMQFAGYWESSSLYFAKKKFNLLD